MENSTISITSSRQQENLQTKQIERAKREWEVTVDALPQLICLLDHQQHILRANRTVERWQLGSVVEVKGQAAHEFLHSNCTDPNCYLVSFLEQAWQKLNQGQSAELETADENLKRYLHLQVRPLSSQTTQNDVDTASFAVLVLDDITEQKQAEQALHQYTLELKTRNEELDAFARTVAHDLKSPLLPIIGNAALLKMLYETMPVEQVQRDLDVITRNAKKMESIIDELLLLAGVRKMDVEIKPLDMAAIITEAQNRLAHMIEECQVEFVLPPTSAWPIALGYGPWVEEVWVNYLSNGLKYGGQPPRLELGATLLEAENMICFWVHDNGPGLKPEELDRLFTPFTQLNHTRDRGHGLGLSIARQIVEKLGGQVSVTSSGVPGQGCVFSFTLPRK